MHRVRCLFVIFTAFCVGLSACATVAPVATASPSATPTIIPTSTPIPTATPEPTPTPPLPESLLSQRQDLENAGYVFEPAEGGGMVLIDTDKDGKETEVVRFGADGGATINGLTPDFKRSKDGEILTLTAEQVKDVKFASSPADDGSGSELSISVKNGNDGYQKVAKYDDEANLWKEVLNLTLEDWRTMYAAVRIFGDNGKLGSADQFFSANEIITDPGQVLEILYPEHITVFNPSGLIEFFVETEVAAEKVRNGAIVVKEKGSVLASPMTSIVVAGDQFMKGNDNIRVLIHDSSSETEFMTGFRLKDRLMDNGLILPARMPRDAEGKYIRVVEIENFNNVYVSKFDDKKSTKLSDTELLEQVLADPDNWAQIIADAGFDRISIRP